MLALLYFPVMCELHCLGCHQTFRISMVPACLDGAECLCGSTMFLFGIEWPPLCMN